MTRDELGKGTRTEIRRRRRVGGGELAAGLAVNGRSGRRVVCVVADNLETFDVEGDEWI